MKVVKYSLGCSVFATLSVCLCLLGSILFVINPQQCACGSSSCPFCLLTNPDAIQAVISTIGIASTSLAIVAEMRGQRTKGILMAEIFDAMFPLYPLTCFLQIYCLIFGLLSCGAENRFSTLLFFCGLLICLSQILYSMWSTSWDKRKANNLAREYIKLLGEKLRLDDPNSMSSIRLQYTCTLASYVGQKFLKQDWLIEDAQSCKKHRKQATLFSDNGDVVGLFNLAKKNGGQIVTDANQTCCDPKTMDLWLRGIGEPGKQRKEWLTTVSRLAQMWQHILSPMTRLQDQSRIIFEVLRLGAAREIRLWLSYGLIFYLVQDAMSYDLSSQESRVIGQQLVLLADVRRLVQEYKNKRDITTPDLDNAYWDICFGMLCLGVFTQIEGSEITMKYKDWLNFIAKTNLDCDRRFNCAENETHIKRQMALSITVLQSMRDIIPSRMTWALDYAVKYVQGTIMKYEYKI